VTPEEIEAMLDALVVKNTADGYEYGEHLPVSEFQLARDVAEAVAKRCAEICENKADCGPDNGCCPTYWSEAAESCAAAIRAEFLPATGQGGG
jgi:hypothetical protein